MCEFEKEETASVKYNIYICISYIFIHFLGFENPEYCTYNVNHNTHLDKVNKTIILCQLEMSNH